MHTVRYFFRRLGFFGSMTSDLGTLTSLHAKSANLPHPRGFLCSFAIVLFLSHWGTWRRDRLNDADRRHYLLATGESAFSFPWDVQAESFGQFPECTERWTGHISPVMQEKITADDLSPVEPLSNRDWQPMPLKQGVENQAASDSKLPRKKQAGQIEIATCENSRAGHGLFDPHETRITDCSQSTVGDCWHKSFQTFSRNTSRVLRAASISA